MDFILLVFRLVSMCMMTTSFTAAVFPYVALDSLSATWARLEPYLMASRLEKRSCEKLPLFTAKAQPNSHADDKTPRRVKRQLTEDSCSDKLTNYGSRASAFVGCAVNHSRPILLCEHCIEEYLLAEKAYQEYTESTDLDGINCQDIVYGSDLIQVAQRANQSIEDLWSDGHCSYCFNDFSINDSGTVKYSFSSGLITFMRKHRNLTDCFNSSGVVVNNGVPNDGMANMTNASVVCRECYPLYKDLTRFFLKNYTEDISKTCIDVVDIMNSTRRMWGKYFHCQRQQHDMFLVWTVVIIVFVTTIVFYIGMFFNSTFEAYIIRRQERLEGPRIFGSFHHVHTTSTSSADLTYAPL